MENELFMDDFYAVSRVGHLLNPWIWIPSSAAIPRNRRAMLGSAALKRRSGRIGLSPGDGRKNRPWGMQFQPWIRTFIGLV